MRIETRGVLFDMDGVLVSSIGSVERSWGRWARDRGMDVMQAVRASHGRRAIDTLRSVAPDVDHAAELAVIEKYECEDGEGIRAFPGVRELILDLPPNAWTIVTSATRKLALIRLEYAGLIPPHGMITAELVTNGKPDPEPYRKGAELLGLAPADCLVIEDAPSGIGAGKTAGCKVLAISNTHKREELAAADWVSDSLDSVGVEVLPDGRIVLNF